jgi:hypothetical protein
MKRLSVLMEVLKLYDGNKRLAGEVSGCFALCEHKGTCWCFGLSGQTRRPRHVPESRSARTASGARNRGREGYGEEESEEFRLQESA